MQSSTHRPLPRQPQQLVLKLPNNFRLPSALGKRKAPLHSLHERQGVNSSVASQRCTCIMRMVDAGTDAVKCSNRAVRAFIWSSSAAAFASLLCPRRCVTANPMAAAAAAAIAALTSNPCQRGRLGFGPASVTLRMSLCVCPYANAQATCVVGSNAKCLYLRACPAALREWLGCRPPLCLLPAHV